MWGVKSRSCGDQGHVLCGFSLGGIANAVVDIGVNANVDLVGIARPNGGRWRPRKSTSFAAT